MLWQTDKRGVFGACTGQPKKGALMCGPNWKKGGLRCRRGGGTPISDLYGYVRPQTLHYLP